MINISDDVYEDIVTHNGENREGAKSAYYFESLIKNGISLPKGHGRLIDAGNFINVLNNEQIEGLNTYKGLGRAKELLIEAPTIIEADKKSEETYEG